MIKNVIVSGACGFIGLRLIKALAADWQIFALDLKKELFEKFLAGNGLTKAENIKFFEADFTNESDLRRVLNEIPDPCSLVHLGGYILGSAKGTQKYDAAKAVEVNVRGSAKLVETLRPKLNSVIAASTLDVYGVPQILPITEEHPLDPQTVYASSKLDMEFLLMNLLKDKMPLTILRFSHVYGKCDPHNKVLKSFAAAVKNGEAPVIYGDGEDLRDHIHVSDIAECIIHALKNKVTGIFNIASGKSYSLKQLAQMIIDKAQKDLKPAFKERVNARKDYVFDISKLENKMKFKPKISIEEGIADLVL